MKTFKDLIIEASLGRVLQHQQNLKVPFALLTAFRGEYDYKTNKKRNKELERLIRQNKYGFFKLEGVWVENKGQEDELEVREESIFVIGGEGDNGKLKGLCKKWMKKYNQDAVLFRPEDTKDGKAVLLFKDGKEQNIGKLSVNKTGEAYSKLRGRKGTFVFESVTQAKNWVNAIIESKKNG